MPLDRHHHHRLISPRGQLLRGGGADHSSSSTSLKRLMPETTAINPFPGQPQKQCSLSHQTRIAGDGRELGVGQTGRHLQADIAQQSMQRLTHKTRQNSARSKPIQRGWTAPVATS